jgi:repressor LexA
MRPRLTARQRQILDFILEQIDSRGFPPTMREIGAQFGISSPNGVRDHLVALQRKEYMKRIPEKSRSLEVAEDLRRDRGKPILGNIAAGKPILAEENFQGLLNLNTLFGRDAAIFALRVEGDSMIKAGIFHGDFVIVKHQPEIAHGEIGVVYIDDEATVKKIFMEGNQLLLQPENDAMSPVVIRREDTRLRIGGRVIGVVRKM